MNASLYRSPIVLTLFAAIAVAIVSYTFKITRTRIIEQERKAILKDIHKLISVNDYDNNIIKDTITLKTNTQLGDPNPTLFYRARKNKMPIALFFDVTANDGYNGNIKFLIGVFYSGKIAGIRIISHRETPGLGDKIDSRKSNWLDQQFKNKSLTKPDINKWLVKKDGGEFDQFTGATITPRAVIKATKKALIYFKANKKHLFAIQKNSGDN